MDYNSNFSVRGFLTGVPLDMVFPLLGVDQSFNSLQLLLKVITLAHA